ncbi:sugar isomerase [Candidatus Scalindua japonica]|uniref:Sugar isomerase n=1 Tax=Candidatus Scalindua japonica TaxID=1284222 RepID=A0A286U171_9BACT|nr:SIS domain-containing protein [Candidatus Scalindua japonica]GAX61889.1 sugar isomerase [Candidatus Scalindua japonica]
MVSTEYILIQSYYKTLSLLFNSIKVTVKEGNEIEFFHVVENVSYLIRLKADSDRKLMFIGNGASAAIASHMTTDYWKNGGIRSMTFNEGPLLSCISNDFGYKYVFEKPIEMFADNGDILIAISSSGKSENILKSVCAARSRECNVITLSGFKKNNPLNVLGYYNFYVPSQEYEPVETTHLSICHSILNCILRSTPSSDKQV